MIVQVLFSAAVGAIAGYFVGIDGKSALKAVHDKELKLRDEVIKYYKQVSAGVQVDTKQLQELADKLSPIAKDYITKKFSR
jgi:uncharacterized protein with HEPN domain